MNFLEAVNLFSGLVLLASLLLVWRKKRFDTYVTPLLWFILVNLFGIVAVIIETAQKPGWWPIGYFFLFAYFAFLPSAWYRLGSRWGLHLEERRAHQRLLERSALLLSLILFLIFLVGRGIDLALVNSRWYVDLRGWSFWISAFLIVGVTGGMYSLETCYRSSIGLARENLRKAFFPLLAGGIGLLAVSTVAMLYHQIGDLMLTITFVLTALVTITVARHYIRFNPAERGVILTRKGIYSSIVVVLVGIYFIVIGLIGQVLVRYNLDDGLFFSVIILSVMVFTFMLVVASQALRSRLKAVSPSGISAAGKGALADEWREFTEEVSVLLNRDMIYAHTAQLLHRLLKIDDSLFVIKETVPSPDYTVFTGDGVDRGVPGEKLERLAQWLHRYGHAVETATLKEKAPSEASELGVIKKLAPFELFLLVPFVARQQFLGFWGIGRHQSRRDLNSEEVGFIEAAANPVALTILTARITDELVISKEIESFHRISSFVLHDLKNSVGMLSMLLQNAEQNMGNPEFQKEALVTIGKAVDRQKKIISRLTGQRTDDKLSLEKVDLRDLIKGTLERVKIDTIKTIDLKFEIQNGTSVIVDAEKVGSVFDNLVMNAIEAMPDGGSLEIRLADVQPPGMVVVLVKDSGKGMDDEFITTRLFKPFSSTKPYGLGIGMYQSQEIIKSHRGRIEVRSEPGRGSRIQVYLPGEK